MKRTMILGFGLLAVAAVASAQPGQRARQSNEPIQTQQGPAFVDADGDGICDACLGDAVGAERGQGRGQDAASRGSGSRREAGSRGAGPQDGSGFLRGGGAGRGSAAGTCGGTASVSQGRGRGRR